ncbi:hypothetical protein AAX29_00555 [Aliarcobacter thereius]|uniref:Tail fiber protein n=1 Tax=Aliarcobacter thereius TaxID=544718 RepID=A0A1C0B7F6_9BACT|nr:hypothetical protein [Aliarcobacter thereius]OCL99514.1 hypothetical protein AAX29_00555 [Aliarcobacter thereius]
MNHIKKLSPFDENKVAKEGSKQFRQNAAYSWEWLVEHTKEVNILIEDLNIYKDGLKGVLNEYLLQNLNENGLNKAVLGLDLVDNTKDTDKKVLSATKLTTARTIGGVAFNGTSNINLPGVNITGNQNTTGNSATATKLTTARTIGGVSFNGTANINLPGVNIAGNQNTSGNAATATKLATSRNIAIAGAVVGSAIFDGSANISINTVAGASQAVGTYILGKIKKDMNGNTPTVSFGGTLPGSSIQTYRSDGNSITYPTGTWRMQGGISVNLQAFQLWQRIA